MGDLPYISSEQGELIIHTELIYEYTIYKRPIPVQDLRAEGGGLYNISWAYNTYYTVHEQQQVTKSSDVRIE